jgi:hypothetical protein
MIILLGEMLAPVAPMSMNTDAQDIFIMAVVKSLDQVGIRADEVAAVQAQVMCKITRHQQILHEISEAVSRKRATPTYAGRRSNPGWRIDQEEQRRRGEARTPAEVEEAGVWARRARIDAGISVPPKQPPFTRQELDRMSPDITSLGIKYGYLEWVGGMLVEAL